MAKYQSSEWRKNISVGRKEAEARKRGELPETQASERPSKTKIDFDDLERTERGPASPWRTVGF